MVKMKITNKKKKKQENRLLYDEVNLDSYKDIAKAKEIYQAEKEKELNKELSRIKLIIDKFTEYNLEITNEEIAETYNRLNQHNNWVDMNASKFHLQFLKVMDYEMKKEGFEFTILNMKPEELKIEVETTEKEKESQFTENEIKYKQELENENK